MSNDPNYRVLVVDDLRRFVGPDIIPITYARDVDTAIHILSKPGVWNQTWLDHDLGATDVRPLIHWMIEHQPKIQQIYVQSMNPVGATWVVDMLSPYYQVQRASSPSLIVP